MSLVLPCLLLTILVTINWAETVSRFQVLGARECVSHEDCPGDRMCTNQMCVDPCVSACGPNTVCHVINHVAICSHIPGHGGHPKTDIILSGCSGHDQCPNSKVCVQGECVDPCNDFCGVNSFCSVKNHIPLCACREGYIGNPLCGCNLLVMPGTWPPIPHGKKQFYVENSKKADWHGALMHCLRNNSRLASIDNMEEMDEIRSLIRKTGRRLGQYWTSGSDREEEGHFIWVTTGVELSSSSDLWLKEPRQPDNFLGEHCVEVWERFQNQGYGLNDRPCHHLVYFICEYYT